jgi:hypothetical protein
VGVQVRIFNTRGVLVQERKFDAAPGITRSLEISIEDPENLPADRLGRRNRLCSANIPSDTKLARARQPLRLAPKPTRSRCAMLPHAETFVLVDRVADDCPVAD